MENTNEQIKTKVIIILSIVFALCIVISLFTGINFSRKLNEARDLAEQYRLEQRAATDTIRRFNDGLNSLSINNRNAIGRINQITEYTIENASNTREAIRIIEQVIIQVKSLNSELDSCRAIINDMRSLAGNGIGEMTLDQLKSITTIRDGKPWIEWTKEIPAPENLDGLSDEVLEYLSENLGQSLLLFQVREYLTTKKIERKL
jgi:type II secretory pathway pseudopilin PulG